MFGFCHCLCKQALGQGRKALRHGFLDVTVVTDAPDAPLERMVCTDGVPSGESTYWASRQPSPGGWVCPFLPKKKGI